MSKKEICKNNEVIAAYTLSNNAGLNVHFIEYGIDDIVYYKAVCGERITYHKSKIYYDSNTERPYFKWGKMKIYLDECIKVNV